MPQLRRERLERGGRIYPGLRRLSGQILDEIAHGADGYISSETLGELTTGNKNIQPETSDSYTAGIVFAPIKQFSAAIESSLHEKETSSLRRINSRHWISTPHDTIRILGRV